MASEPALNGIRLPTAAGAAWVRLRRLLDRLGPVPCQIGPAEAWWPDAKAARGPGVQRAVAGCRRCPVSQACLEYALAADERFGVWGGTLPEQRRQMRWRRAD